MAKPLSYSISGLCEASGLGRSKVYSLIADGTLQTITVGGRRLIIGESVERFYANAGDKTARGINAKEAVAARPDRVAKATRAKAEVTA